MMEQALQSKGLTRRRLLQFGAAALTTAVGTGVYSLLEASWLRVVESEIPMARLPAPFSGLRVAFLSDIHHGPFTGLKYIESAIATTRALKPDLILLGGDYVHQDPKYIEPCFQVLSRLSAPLGVFAVLGNHDNWESRSRSREAMLQSGITNLDNTGIWLSRNGARLRLGGVGDFWTDRQDLSAALGDAGDADAALVLSHNPDFAERIRNPRVSLMLSGHTHGGQVRVPGYGAPLVPSRYGQKYLQGLVQAPATQVFVSRGVGTVTPPVRFNCRPEINLLTLVSA